MSLTLIYKLWLTFLHGSIYFKQVTDRVKVKTDELLTQCLPYRFYKCCIPYMGISDLVTLYLGR